MRGPEIEPSIYAADFARLGDDMVTLLEGGAKIFQFDVGDGHFVEPITIGPIVAQAISPLFRERGGILDVHLMVDNPEHHFEPFEKAGRTTSPSITRSSTTRRLWSRTRGARPRCWNRVQSRDRSQGRRGGAGRRPRPVHGSPPRLLGPGLHPGDGRARAPAGARCSADVQSRWTAAWESRTSASSARRVPTFVAGSSVFAHEDPVAATASSPSRSVMPLSWAVARKGGKGRARTVQPVRTRPARAASCREGGRAGGAGLRPARAPSAREAG